MTPGAGKFWNVRLDFVFRAVVSNFFADIFCIVPIAFNANSMPAVPAFYLHAISLVRCHNFYSELDFFVLIIFAALPFLKVHSAYMFVLFAHVKAVIIRLTVVVIAVVTKIHSF